MKRKNETRAKLFKGYKMGFMFSFYDFIIRQKNVRDEHVNVFKVQLTKNSRQLR